MTSSLLLFNILLEIQASTIREGKRKKSKGGTLAGAEAGGGGSGGCSTLLLPED